MRIARDGMGMTLLLAGLGALPPLSIDMALPALSRIARDMAISPGLAGLTLSLFMAGFACTPIVYGPLSDRHGRRPVLLAGLVLFTLGGAAAATAPSIVWLLAARLLQGAGAGAGTSMAFAIVRDLFEGHQARQRLSGVTIVMTIAPLLAPSIGAIILGFAGWRAIWGLLTAAGAVLTLAVLLGFAESRPAAARAARPGLLRGYARMLGNRASLGFALVYALGFAVQFSFISGSPLVLIGVFGASPRLYGVLFACNALGIAGGAAVNRRLSARRVAPAVPLGIGLGLFLVASGSMLALQAAGLAGIASFMPPIVLSSFAWGLASANAAHGALEPVPELAGTASAVLTCLQMAFAAIASLLVAFLFAWIGVAAMTGMMAAFGLLAAATWLLVAHPARLGGKVAAA
jgi:DHA1 family bicyclomycin/chloramphenicol resistance-like MFS transporter